MLHTDKWRPVHALFLGITFAVSFTSSALAETRVTFKAGKDEVKKACDAIEGGGGVPVSGGGGQGYGCYNTNNGVLVACSDGGTCTGYLPKGSPRSKSLEGVLNFGSRASAPAPRSLSEGSSGGSTQPSQPQAPFLQ
jgi:hypothetical protein